MQLKNLLKVSCLCVWLTFGGVAYGQSYQKINQGVKAEVDGISVEMAFYSPDMIRVVKYPGQEKPDKKSYAVVKTPEQVAFTVSEEEGQVMVKSNAMSVCLNLTTGKITYMDAQNQPLLAEKDYGCQFTPVEYDGNPSFVVRQAFRLDKEEAVYGLGQHQKGKMNQRNLLINLKQVNTDIAIPFMQSVKGYGVYWDNTSPTTFTDNTQETAFDSQSGPCADYYFMYGGTADKVVALMRGLTGRVQMNALWTYGFWQSKERYQSQEELLGVVKKYRDLQVPLDGIVQDWQYWGTDNKDWNSVEFGNPLFPDPKGMIDEVHKQNAHIIISVWPSFGMNSRIHREMKEKGFLLDFNTYPGEAKVFDVFHPKARDLYWNYMNRNMFSLGMDGWWLDATEPEFSDKDEKLNQMTYDGQYRGVYNAFPIVTVGSVYDHQRAVSSDKRVFILTRSAFAGQQRYGANSWSGDINSTWEVLHNQISAGVNFSACAIPYWNTDIGGFVACTYPGGVANPAFRELYVRWTQFGAFTPMMRSHGTCTPREIYQFGEKGSWEFDALEKYICLRYKLLPYIYSTAWGVSHNDDTFMRGLFMDFPDDRKACELNDQYLFGRSILVAPVTEAMYVDTDKKEDFSIIKTRKVYLPKGTGWTDFWTGERLQGGQMVTKETPIDIMPLYVKCGSILPIGPQVQYATEKRWNNLEIRVYPGADGEFLLYEDENDNYNYEKGAYSTIAFHWDDHKRVLTIGGRDGEFPGMLKNRKFNIVLVGEKRGTGDTPASKVNKTVSYNGKAVNVKL